MTMCQCGHDREDHRYHEHSCNATTCGCRRFTPAPMDVPPPRRVFPELDHQGRVLLPEGFIYTLNARLDTLERKLDWLHDAVLSDPTFRGWPAMFRDWPGSLSQRTPEGT